MPGTDNVLPPAPGGEESPPDALDALWRTAPTIDVDGVWQRVAAGLPPQAAAARARPIPLLLHWRGGVRRLAAAAAVLVVAAIVAAGVLLSTGDRAEASLLEQVDAVSAATADAISDGTLSSSERENLDALVRRLLARLQTGDDLAGLSAPEVDALVIKLSILQATLAAVAVEGAVEGAADSGTVAALGTATAAAQQERAGRAAGAQLVTSLNRRAEAADLFTLADLPITIVVAEAGTVTIAATGTGLGVANVTTQPGWSAQIEADGPGETGVDFRKGGVRLMVRAEIEDGQVRIRTGTERVGNGNRDDGEETFVAPAAATPELRSFVVRSAGVVVLELRPDGIGISHVLPQPGWSFSSEVEDGGREIRVDFHDGVSRVRFEAAITDGGVKVEIEERADGGCGEADDDADDASSDASGDASDDDRGGAGPGNTGDSDDDRGGSNSGSGDDDAAAEDDQSDGDSGSSEEAENDRGDDAHEDDGDGEGDDADDDRGSANPGRGNGDAHADDANADDAADTDGENSGSDDDEEENDNSGSGTGGDDDD